MPDHDLTISNNLGVKHTTVSSGMAWGRGCTVNLGLDDSTPVFSMIVRRAVINKIAFDDSCQPGRLILGQTAVGVYNEPEMPPELTSGYTRGITLTTATTRIFPFVDRTSGTLTGTNSLSWTYNELKDMVGCVIRVDPLDSNFLDAQFFIRHDGYDSVHEPAIAAGYSAPNVALIDDLTRPGWKPVSFVNPMFVSLKNLYRLRATVPEGTVKIAVEVFVPGGEFRI